MLCGWLSASAGSSVRRRAARGGQRSRSTNHRPRSASPRTSGDAHLITNQVRTPSAMATRRYGSAFGREQTSACGPAVERERITMSRVDHRHRRKFRCKRAAWKSIPRGHSRALCRGDTSGAWYPSLLHQAGSRLEPPRRPGYLGRSNIQGALGGFRGPPDFPPQSTAPLPPRLRAAFARQGAGPSPSATPDAPQDSACNVTPPSGK
jgi:hypothetical protein